MANIRIEEISWKIKYPVITDIYLLKYSSIHPYRIFQLFCNNLLPVSGYYYELDDSYDESDEEDVRAHLRRVAQQPPLKLDASTEVQSLISSVKDNSSEHY